MNVRIFTYDNQNDHLVSRQLMYDVNDEVHGILSYAERNNYPNGSRLYGVNEDAIVTVKLVVTKTYSGDPES